MRKPGGFKKLGTCLGSSLKQGELGVVTAPGRGKACISSSVGPLGSKALPTRSLWALQGPVRWLQGTAEHCGLSV